MGPEKRREKLLNKLKNSDKPIIGSELADIFNVSRQAIVQDIALLRAQGERILATSQGYLFPDRQGSQNVRTTIACRHGAGEEVKEELMTIVDHGARVIDVSVEHPIYGELKGMLMIQSPADVDNFINNCQNNKASLLASLTDGVHLHTIEAVNKQVIKKIKERLEQKGYLLDRK